MSNLCQIDLVRLDWPVPVAGCVESRNPYASASTQCPAAQIPEGKTRGNVAKILASGTWHTETGLAGWRERTRWRPLAFELQRRRYAARGWVLPGSSAQ